MYFLQAPYITGHDQSDFEDFMLLIMLPALFFIGVIIHIIRGIIKKRKQ